MKTENLNKCDIEHINSSPAPHSSVSSQHPAVDPSSIGLLADVGPHSSRSAVPRTGDLSFAEQNNDPTPSPADAAPSSPISSFADLVFRTGSLLARLTQEQRSQLFQWLVDHSIADVLNFVAAPSPQGFGLQTHKTTLRRIKAFIRSKKSCTAYESSSAGAELLTETIREHRPQFAPVISELLLQKAFDLANNQDQTHDLKDLIHSAIKLRELDLKVQRLQLFREKPNSPARRQRIRVNHCEASQPANSCHVFPFDPQAGA